MIGYLSGKVISSKPTSLLIDVNGVGYIVSISINTFEKIADKETVNLFIYTSVKEDAINLYGFYTEPEKEMFELLISVNGVGPKIALSILSGIQIEELKEAIYSSNTLRISAVPGIGKKTAERLVLELRSKVDRISSGTVNIPFNIKNEAVLALTTLGYNSKIAENAMRDVLSTSPDSPLEDLIKKALSLLNR